jgi:hypothetical protein
MKETLNITLWCLAAAVAMRLAFDANAQRVETPTAKKEYIDASGGAAAFKGKVADEWRYWLFVQRHNLRDYEERGYDPCFVSITSTYKPIVRRRDDGLFEITFQSDASH